MKSSSPPTALEIIGARENNLRSLSLEIPHDRFVTITGLSGSGKSSLAFDTIYAEGQRRYVETFSPYTRQFFDKVKRPDVDSIRNVRPAVAIQQRTRILSSRSTVGSMTDVNDYLKLIWSNLGIPSCPECNRPLQRWTAVSLADHLQQVAQSSDATLFLVTAEVIVSKKKADFFAQVDRIQTLGYSRYLDPQSGSVQLIEDAPPKFKAGQQNSFVVVLDRFDSRRLERTRLIDALDQAFSLGHGSLRIAETGTDGTLSTRRYTQQYSCDQHETIVEIAKPSLFSFNHPSGACPECTGFGKVLSLDRSKIVPDLHRTLKDGAFDCWSGKGASWEQKQMLRFCAAQGIPVDVPWKDLTSQQQEELFHHKDKNYIGIVPWFSHLETKKYKMHVRVFLSKFRTQVLCPVCNGTRLKRSALSYRVEGITIAEVAQWPVEQLLGWFQELYGRERKKKSLPSGMRAVFEQIISRLQYLNDLGLPYLTLDRQARTLSGGETQRVNLASALGSNLVSTHFVLDEPSVGLHARDTDRLLGALRTLCSRGNSLTVVEHDLDCLESSDVTIELGPAAGEHGGQVTYAGPTAEWAGITLSPVTLSTRASTFSRFITIQGANLRNLRGADVTIPLDAFVTITGVSGSGKSSLVTELLVQEFERWSGRATSYTEPLATQIDGFQWISSIAVIDQNPLAKSPRANIATYTKIWDRIRELLASTEEAKLRHLTRSSFSFNVAAGRCPACEGAGFIREDMQFLSDVFVRCDTCLGRRFQPTVLEVQLRGKSVDDLLNSTIDEIFDFFPNEPQIQSTLRVFQELGLGYLRLGHSLSELSGGEAQRLKLIPWIRDSGQSSGALLIFDEPTTGLHMHDVEKLAGVLRRLREQGHSVLCVEHNQRVMLESDWLIDLGPEGGDGGGKIVFAGPPAECIRLGKASPEQSHTARHLALFVDRYLPGLLSETGRLSAKPKLRARTKAKVITPGHTTPKTLGIRGAREHNLKNISLDIPLHQIVTFTGVSGSGKSSIAKDIIYAEGQRRYLDCLSPYARQFIKELKRPELDEIHNIAPTVCVYQHTFQPSALSTVGTLSEVYNFLRLLYAKVGEQFCPQHPEHRISPLSVEEISIKILADFSAPLRILAPIITQKKGTHRAVLARAIETEVSEIRLDGKLCSPDPDGEPLDKRKAHSIEYVVVRCNPKTISLDLLKEGVAQAITLGNGTIVVLSEGKETIFSTDRTCPICKMGFFKPDPEDLSFHSKRGACEKCRGFGVVAARTCPECQGERINELGRNLKIKQKSIALLCAGSIDAVSVELDTLQLSSSQSLVAEPILRELRSKLSALRDLGLGYVPLARDCSSLSGGELQRLRLATAIGSPLSGIVYILDEPSAGLHPLDNRRLIRKLRELRERKNSVIQIEHESDSILASDYIVDVGPEAGRNGGEIVFSGTLSNFLAESDSITSRLLREQTVPKDLAPSDRPKLTIRNGARNCIKNLSLDIPLQSLVTVAGVSGAGKSSLVHGIIAEALCSTSKDQTNWRSGFGTLSSELPIERLLVIDQNPIGANSRSTPASYLGIFDLIRTVFAGALESKSRGWTASFFSYNTGKGRCPECKGLGEITLEMNFLADAKVSCDLCSGRRYTIDAESVKYNGKNISEVLAMTFDEAKIFFVNHRRIHKVIKQACDLGLGYLSLGQSSKTLSGGESQRLKLAAELDAARRGHTLYILDEPTTGLHKADVKRLLEGLEELVKLGHSVIVIEHDSDVLLRSDQVIEIGPGAGMDGGKVIFQGTPSELTAADTPWGELLRDGAMASRSTVTQYAAPLAATNFYE
jgi:excinuclease ABC subunit A